MTSSRWLGLAPLLAVPIAAPLAAQWPIGAATPVAGARAELFGAPLWLGNLTYGYRIENGPPHGAALLVVSIARHDTTLLGLQLYPSLGPGDVLVVDSGVLDAAGRLELPRPLPGPEIPALAGLRLYAQAAVGGPAGLGATQGLLVEAALHPMLAFGSPSTGLQLIDLVLGTMTPVVGPPSPYEAVFGNGGRDLFVASSQGLHVVDTTAAVPAATPLVTGQACGRLTWNRVHRRLYLIRQRIEVVDGDPASPTFGTVLAHVPPGPSFLAGELAANADGTRLVHANYAGHFERYDIDPASPSYLQPIPTPPPLFQPGFGTTLESLHVAPDGSTITLVIRVSPGRTSLHRFDTAANAWIDHDPALAGVQPASDLTHPALPFSYQLHTTRDGTRAFATGSPASARLGFELGGTALAVVPSPVPPSGLFFWYFGTTPTGRYLLGRQLLGTGDVLSLVDAANGTVLPLATLPTTGGNFQFAAWR